MQNIRKGAVALMASLAAVLVAGTAHAEFLMSGSLNLSAGFATTRNIAAGSVQVLGTPGSLMIPQSAFALSGMAFRTFPTTNESFSTMTERPALSK